MAHIIYIAHDGARGELVVAAGENLMMAAADAGFPGIVGACGGNAMCATCHVYVDPAWLDKLPAMSADEDALLDGAAAERKSNSRLSCQIIAADTLDGMIVHTPDRQT